MADLEPLRLFEDEAGGRFLIYTNEAGVQLDLRFVGDTLWMTQAQAASLFGVTVPSISRHIANIYEDGELDREATLTEIETVRSEGGRQVARTIEHYSLDMIISVGYRVSSKQGTLFRRWATDKLVQYATKGFVVDAPRLKQPDSADRVTELRDIIRDIRSDEANVYRELRRICALCQDYDPTSQAAREFYSQTQAKLIFAVTSHTPSEVVYGRADSAADNMGLTNWSNANIRKSDVSIAKAYFGDSELRELNRLTVILLDIFDDQLELGRLTLMSDATALLEAQLKGLGRQVLRSGGRVSHDSAKAKAEREYEKYKARLKDERHRQADEAISTIASTVKGLAKPPRKKG